MNEIASVIKIFFEQREGHYCNLHKVDFLDNYQNLIMADYSEVYTPENKYLELFLSYTGKNIQRFIKDFNITQPKDIDDITSDHLWSLFHKGIVEINCFTGKELDAPFLTFRYKQGRLLVKDEYEIEYTVSQVLKTSGDFVNFTLKYYEEMMSSAFS